MREQEDECERCQSIYWNLIKILESGKSQRNPTLFIREFFQTERCDSYSDLSKEREAYKNKIGDEALENIFNFRETICDEKKCAQAVLHYGYWNQKRLISSLNLRNRIFYQSFNQPTRLLELVTVFGLGYAGMKVASKAMSAVRTRFGH